MQALLRNPTAADIDAPAPLIAHARGMSGSNIGDLVVAVQVLGNGYSAEGYSTQEIIHGLAAGLGACLAKGTPARNSDDGALMTIIGGWVLEGLLKARNARGLS